MVGAKPIGYGSDAEQLYIVIDKIPCLVLSSFTLVSQDPGGGCRVLHAVVARNLRDGADTEYLHAVSAKIPVVGAE